MVDKNVLIKKQWFISSSTARIEDVYEIDAKR